MIRGTPRYTHTRWEQHEREHPPAISYLLGTIGVAIVIAVAVFMAQKAGWLDGVQKALHQIELPGLPSAQVGVPDVLPGFADKVRNVKQSTTTLWQRGSEGPQQLQQPSAADRRD